MLTIRLATKELKVEGLISFVANLGANIVDLSTPESTKLTPKLATKWLGRRGTGLDSQPENRANQPPPPTRS